MSHYLCWDFVWPRATRPQLVLTENERIIISLANTTTGELAVVAVLGDEQC